ncbi:MAG: AAA family ATPase [bacterium]
MAFRTPVGIDDFQQLRQQGATYVDKSAFVREVMDTAQVLLITRPRRFGKTLNLSLLRYFFERSDEDRAPLFEDLAVWQDAEMRAHFQRYPVVALTLKGVKAASFEEMIDRVGRLLAEETARHRELLTSEAVDARDRALLTEVVGGRASAATCEEALRSLTRALAAHHGAKVVLLIDEYDAPIERALAGGYFDAAVGFFRNFLGAGFKGNHHIVKGLLTGVLRIAKESLFSDLNNLAVYTPLSRQFTTAFGFTEPEVITLAALAGRSHHLDAIRRWYNGYRFGDDVIYNPWSVLRYLSEPDQEPHAYWVSTGEHSLIDRMFAAGGPGRMADHMALLRGETIRKRLSDQLALRDLFGDEAAIWSLLLFAGYLTGEARFEGDHRSADLRIPNFEVRGVYTSTLDRWLEPGAGGQGLSEDFIAALLAGDAEQIEALLGRIVLYHFSYHDLPANVGERIYQAFVLGLLVRLERTHIVRSNRETGYGRADVTLRPRDGKGAGVVIELKALSPVDRLTPEQALDRALAQIEARDDAAELRAEGIDPIHRLAIVFEGKRVYARAG